MEHEDTQERTDNMSENMVAIRCKSELNPWMDCVMVVPQEQADDIEQSIKERMRGFERNGSCYGDVMREIAQAAGIESLTLCDYDEDTDEPTDAWCEYCAGLSQKMPVIEIDIGELGDEVNIDDLLDKAEELGWCIRESDTEWEFIQNSPAGEDFFFDISASDVHNAGDMVREIRSYANSFDAEEHANSSCNHMSEPCLHIFQGDLITGTHSGSVLRLVPPHRPGVYHNLSPISHLKM